MSPAEQAAFLEAYANNVADASPEVAAEFVRRFVAGEDIDYSWDYTSIMDSLLVWNHAINWKLTQLEKNV